MAGVPAAGEDQRTRDALAAYRAGALRWLLGGSIAVVLGVVMAAATLAVFRDTGRTLPLVGLVVVVAVTGGAVAAVAGLGSLLRSRRWARGLARTPWLVGVLRIAGPAVVAFEPEGYDEWNPAHEPVRLQLLSTTVWRTRAVQALDGAPLRAAPVGGREWVLLSEGHETLFGAKVRGRRS